LRRFWGKLEGFFGSSGFPIKTDNSPEQEKGVFFGGKLPDFTEALKMGVFYAATK
jgi:hypothetical protein